MDNIEIVFAKLSSETSKKKVKKINIGLMKDMEFQKKLGQMVLLFGYMEQVLVSLLQL